MRIAWLLALAGCGRYGFSDKPGGHDIIIDGGASDSSAAMNSIRLTLMTDSAGAQNAGLPIPGATVLIDRGTGALERLTTDDTGAVSLRPDGIVAYHVLYGGGDNPWRLYTIATGALGPITLGGNGFTSGGTMTLNVPAVTNGEFSLNIPGRCGGQTSHGNKIPIDYTAECEGQTVRAVCFETTDFSTWKYLDVGTVKLANATTAAVAGSYVALAQHKVVLTGVPAGISATAQVFTRSQLDLTLMQHDDQGLDSTTTMSGTTATVTMPAAPGGNTVLASFGSPNTKIGVAFGGDSVRFIPATFSTTAPFTATVDGSIMMRPITDVEFDSKAGLTWAGGTGGTITVLDLSTDKYHWTAYLGPAAQSLPFPVIPADIGFPSSQQVSGFDLMKFDIPGATAAGLTPQIDQLWHRWPSDPALLPDTGAGEIRASYIMGL
jgi:hypothetical protein